MSFIKSVEDVYQLLTNSSTKLVIVDVRFDLTNPNWGMEQYRKSHIPGAFYLHLEKDLSGKVQEHGGNHPLPDMEMFAEELGKIGINEKTNIVIYDQANDMYASRLWWMLHYMGHPSVYVLDGGFEAWVKAGFPVTSEIPTPKPVTYEPRLRANEVVHMEQVKEKMSKKSAILIDSRARERYLGKVEPLYSKAGHIPGAINYFWKEVFTQNGRWKSVDELKNHFSDLSKDEEIIVSCGSGVSATPNILALKMAGFENVKLYPGSFSDWISYEENEVVTEEE
jgi:thiosulfate/3-mercaptopyruvate sulfurtransferase